MKTLIGLAAAAALGATAGTAMADGGRYGSVKDAAPAVECCQVNWNGLYIGAGVGYAIGVVDRDIAYYDYSIFRSEGLSNDGFQGVVSLGYDRQIHPGFVVGIFGDYAFGDLDRSESLIEGLIGVKSELSNHWAIGARVGLVRSCCSMWFVTAGYTQADHDWSASFEGYRIASGGKTLSGYFVGAGVEQQIRDNLFLKLEYRFTNFDEERLVSYGPFHVDTDTDIHSIRLGVNWKFDLFHDRGVAPAPLK